MFSINITNFTDIFSLFIVSDIQDMDHRLDFICITSIILNIINTQHDVYMLIECLKVVSVSCQQIDQLGTHAQLQDCDTNISNGTSFSICLIIYSKIWNTIIAVSLVFITSFKSWRITLNLVQFRRFVVVVRSSYFFSLL